MPDIEYTGPGRRIGGSCGGLIVGPILFLISFPLLFKNEGCAVDRARTLAEGKKAAVDVSADKVDPANDTHLVHVTGEATTTEPLTDKDFGVSVNALKLNRTVEIYQWTQTTRTERKKRLGGGEDVITYYNHKKEWVKDPIPSNSFKPDSGNDDGGIPRTQIVNRGTKTYPDLSQRAKVVKLGAFILTDDLLNQLHNEEKLPATMEMLATAVGPGKDRLKVSSGDFYLWYSQEKQPDDDPRNDEPRIGDQRISFTILKPQNVSVLARQVNGSFEAWTEPGGKGTINKLEAGIHSKEEMEEHIEAANVALTWFLRFAGFGLMAFGIYLVGSPFVALANILPILGDFVAVAIAIVAILIAIPLTLITIAIGWCAYRPWVGYPMLAVGVLGLGWIIYLGLKRVPRKGTQAP